MPSSKNSQTFPYIACVLAFIAIAIMIGLGIWQLDRKAEKDARLDQIQQAQAQDNVDITKVAEEPYLYEDFIVSAKGNANNQIFFIDNKIVSGKPGYHVLVPLQTNQGLVMLNLGWVSSTGSREVLPKVKIPMLSEIQGVLYIPTLNKIITETNSRYGQFPVLLQQVDLEEIKKHIGKPLLPFVLRLTESAPQSESNFIRDWQVVTMSPEKHLGYAIQWFGLAIAALTVFLLTMLKWMNGPQHRLEQTEQD